MSFDGIPGMGCACTDRVSGMGFINIVSGQYVDSDTGNQVFPARMLFPERSYSSGTFIDTKTGVLMDQSGRILQNIGAMVASVPGAPAPAQAPVSASGVPGQTGIASGIKAFFDTTGEIEKGLYSSPTASAVIGYQTQRLMGGKPMQQQQYQRPSSLPLGALAVGGVLLLGAVGLAVGLRSRRAV